MAAHDGCVVKLSASASVVVTVVAGQAAAAVLPHLPPVAVHVEAVQRHTLYEDRWYTGRSLGQEWCVILESVHMQKKMAATASGRCRHAF